MISTVLTVKHFFALARFLSFFSEHRAHACKLDVDIIGWQNIEPQAGGLNTFVGDFLSLSDYIAKYNFNYVYFSTV